MFEELIKQDKESYLNDYTEIDIEGTKVKVYKKVPIELKKDVIESVLELSLDKNGVYNELLLDVGFAVSVLNIYTDIKIEENDDINVIDIYNYFNRRGYFSDIVNAIDEEEYKQLFNYITAQKNANEKAHIGLIKIFTDTVTQLPEYFDNLKQILNNMNSEDYKKLINVLSDARK